MIHPDNAGHQRLPRAGGRGGLQRGRWPGEPTGQAEAHHRRPRPPVTSTWSSTSVVRERCAAGGPGRPREPRLRGLWANSGGTSRPRRHSGWRRPVSQTAATPPLPTSSRVCPGAETPTSWSSILHDWGDDDCLRMGRGRRHAAMAPGTGLARILEKVLDPDPARPAREQAELHLVDLHMLVLFAGCARSSDEYAARPPRPGSTRPSCTRLSAPWNTIQLDPSVDYDGSACGCTHVH